MHARRVRPGSHISPHPVILISSGAVSPPDALLPARPATPPGLLPWCGRRGAVRGVEPEVRHDRDGTDRRTTAAEDHERSENLPCVSLRPPPRPASTVGQLRSAGSP